MWLQALLPLRRACSHTKQIFFFYIYTCQTLTTVLQQGVQKCDCFWVIHILSNRFSPIKIQLGTVLNFWLVSVCMKEWQLIKEGHIFRFLTVTGHPLWVLFGSFITYFKGIFFNFKKIRSVPVLPWRWLLQVKPQKSHVNYDWVHFSFDFLLFGNPLINV